jgi:hypothetical protein
MIVFWLCSTNIAHVSSPIFMLAGVDENPPVPETGNGTGEQNCTAKLQVLAHSTDNTWKWAICDQELRLLENLYMHHPHMNVVMLKRKRMWSEAALCQWLRRVYAYGSCSNVCVASCDAQRLTSGWLC